MPAKLVTTLASCCAKGTDPVQQRLLDKMTRQAAAAYTFEAVAREFHATHHTGWSPRYAERWIDSKTDTYFNGAKAALAAFTALIDDARSGRQIKG